MGKVEMAVKGWAGELEKGDVVYVDVLFPEKEEEELLLWRWRRAELKAYYYAVTAGIIFLLLLGQYGFFTCVRPATRSIQVAGVPQYVIDYAPFVWLDQNENYLPSDMYDQVANTQPNINQSSIQNPPSPLTLENLDSLNEYGNNGMNVYLTSIADVTEGPKWLEGVAPDPDGKTGNAISAAIIVNDKGNGTVDAFYMYFYAYNLGNTVLFQELGDHIGDWEHNMIRFQKGQPDAIWYSQHGNGEAFYYSTVEKMGIRPITYSAKGSHASYAIAGVHDHTIPDLNLPAGFLQDYTSQGKLWDPTLSTYYYNYHAETQSFSSIDDSPVGAMAYKGRWGDEQYPDEDPRQPPPFFGFRKYTSGPTGPWDKQLNRDKICPDNGILCIVRDRLGP